VCVLLILQVTIEIVRARFEAAAAGSSMDLRAFKHFVLKDACSDAVEPPSDADLEAAFTSVSTDSDAIDAIDFANLAQVIAEGKLVGFAEVRGSSLRNRGQRRR